MMKLLSCRFNMDTSCVVLLLRDGRKVSIDCTGIEDALDVTMAQQTELDYLIYNDPLGYADLIASFTNSAIPNDRFTICNSRLLSTNQIVNCDGRVRPIQGRTLFLWLFLPSHKFAMPLP